MSTMLGTQSGPSGVRSLMRRKTPSTLTGMNTQNSGALGAQPMQNPADRSKSLGNMYDRLIMGDNPAADQADRTALNDLGAQRAEREASFGQEAAQMGLKPGDVGYAQARSRVMSPLASQGSSVLANLTGQRLQAQRQNLNDAAGFNLGQQEFGEGQRRFDLNRGDNRADAQTRNMFELLGMSDLLSEGQAGAVKAGIGGALGLGGDQWNAQDPDQWTQAIKERMAWYKATNPTMADEEAMAKARQDLGNMDPMKFLQEAGAPQYTGIPGQAGAGAGGEGGAGGWDNPAADYFGATNPLYNGIFQGGGHTAGEVGRGFRDMGRGDVLGGAGRVVAAPLRGVTHGVADTARKAKRTLKGAWDLIT